jgi:hypothetical protein
MTKYKLTFTLWKHRKKILIFNNKKIAEEQYRYIKRAGGNPEKIRKVV